MRIPWRKHIDPGPIPDGEKLVTIVSGLPRSGTSMVMKMLEAGGMDLLVDDVRLADESNPKGYYEFERVKKLTKGDTLWLADAQGKAVKVISALLTYLPPDYRYRVVFMQRRIGEILASQKKMLVARNEATGDLPDDQMVELYQRHLDKVTYWINSQPNLEALFLNYNQLIEDPDGEITRLVQFLGHQPLTGPKMVETIDFSLYRQRKLSA